MVFDLRGLLSLRQKDDRRTEAYVGGMFERWSVGGRDLARGCSTDGSCERPRPGRARTTIGRGAIFVVVEDTLTVAERELIRIGDEETVMRVRHGLPLAMHEDMDADIER